jgi:hypothetical protein
MVDRSNPTQNGLDRRRFQFSLRSLFLLTFVVALFCSAATTFEGMVRLFAFAVLAWTMIGVTYWRRRAGWLAISAHVCGPIVGAILWAGSVWRHSVWTQAWETLLGVGFVAGALVSVGIVCVGWFRGRQ